MYKYFFRYRQSLFILGAVTTVSILAIILFDFNFSLKPSQLVLDWVGVTPQAAKTPPTYEALTTQVVPPEGYTIPVRWGDIGIILVEAGGIDLDKYRKNYTGNVFEDDLTYLTQDKGDRGITITPDNAYFWVNTLWALGLTQKSQVLDEGVMGTEYKDSVGNFASTGGWTLGSQDAVKLFSSSTLIPLTGEQEERVTSIAEGIYRPCCDNPTSFPDCNHGMAMLGMIELMVSQGFADDEIYRAALALNSYWFPSTYVDIAYYYQLQENISWDKVDPKQVLGRSQSSASGFAQLKKQIGTVPGSQIQGGSCGA